MGAWRGGAGVSVGVCAKFLETQPVVMHNDILFFFLSQSFTGIKESFSRLVP